MTQEDDKPAPDAESGRPETEDQGPVVIPGKYKIKMTRGLALRRTRDAQDIADSTIHRPVDGEL